MKIAPRLLCRDPANLLHPFLIWMSRDPGYTHAPAFQMKEEQHVVGHQPTPSEHLHGKEITTRQYIHMGGKKVLPCRDLASLRSGTDTMATEYVPYRLIGHLMTQVGEGANDPVISPARVLSRHS